LNKLEVELFGPSGKPADAKEVDIQVGDNSTYRDTAGGWVHRAFALQAYDRRPRIRGLIDPYTPTNQRRVVRDLGKPRRRITRFSLFL
jgi:hypothetical protein